MISISLSNTPLGKTAMYVTDILLEPNVFSIGGNLNWIESSLWITKLSLNNMSRTQIQDHWLS